MATNTSSWRYPLALFDDGVAGDLPASPRFEGRPRLLVGGGSDRLLDLAGTHADHVDLDGSSRRRALGRTLPLLDGQARRRATTVEDLVDTAEGDDCPYVLNVAVANAERIGLTSLVLPESADLDAVVSTLR